VADPQRLAEALKSSMVDHALVALVTVDDAGRIVQFNPAAEAVFGRRFGEVLGRAFHETLLPPRHHATWVAALARLRDVAVDPAIAHRRFELQALRADGSSFSAEARLYRSDVEGKAYVSASLIDVTERQQAAQELERQRDALRQSEKLAVMGSLLAGVAHELNNPLAIVMGRTSLLEEKCADPALKGDVQRIREAAERCGRIVRTFLNMARSKPPTRAPVSFNDLVRAALEMLSYAFRSHGIVMEVDLAGELPSVNADGDQIGQIVLNLLVNAQQALASAHGERRVLVQTGVEVRRENREPRVWLRVADTGPGLAPSVRDQVFEPFFTTKPEGIGTGLGLSVSRSLAREHGGDLTLEPKSPFGGASFRLNLPISGEPPRDALPDASPLDAAVTSRVLVVDDEQEIAGLMRDMLESAGYEVAVAESGLLALEMLETARFDAIVSDIRMPEMDGAALWHEVVVRHPLLAQRMLFVTGDTLSPYAREFLKESQCSGLDKPFSKGALLDGVARLLE
jgi:two-component system NtrC family sensor kinase